MTTHLVPQRTTTTIYLELLFVLAAIGISAGVTYWLQEARYANRVSLIPTLEASFEKAEAEAQKVPKLTEDLASTKATLEQSQATEKQKTMALETTQQQLRATKQQAQSLENRLFSVSEQLAVVQGQNTQLKACIVDLKQSIDGIQALRKDLRLSHRELNTIGKFDNWVDHTYLLRKHLVQIHQTWTNGNCQHAQNTL